MRHNVQKNEVAALAKQLPEKSNERLHELTDDCRLLVVSHMPLAYAMAWRMKDCGLDLNDLRQEGCLGLCEAALRYDENVDCSFAAYASHWCRKMMLAAIHRHERRAEEPHEEARQEEYNDENLLRLAQEIRIDEALNCLTERERLVIRQFYGIGTKRLSINEIASQLGISRVRASCLHRRALEKLEAALMERPLVDYLTPWLE